MKTTITERGQVSIPAELRREMKLEPGQIVIWERLSSTECRLFIEPKPAVKPDPMGAIGFAKRHGLQGGTTAQWMSILREGDED